MPMLIFRAWATCDITVRGVDFILNCAYLERASLHSLYIPLSTRSEISAALE